MVKFHIVLTGLLLILFTGISLQAQDTTSVTGEDSLFIETPQDSLSIADLLASDTTQARKKIKVIRREYKFRDQIGSAVGMMIFMAIILITVQNWNPD
jgi:hypothetical protein